LQQPADEWQTVHHSGTEQNAAEQFRLDKHTGADQRY
jgi:hypothetical protein